MAPDIAYALFFGGLALIAQYLPARWGVPIGLATVGLSAWQLGWVGWPLWLGIVLAGLVVWRIFLHRGIFEKEKTGKREQARNLHNKIVELDLSLEKKKSELSKDGDWQQNPDIRDILDKLQTELNNLGYLVNSYDYDRWAEAMMSLHSKKFHFHIKDNDVLSEWGRARINAKLRAFIKKVKE